MTVNSQTQDLYVKRVEISGLTDNVLNLAGLGTSGSIGTAPHTVDVYNIITIDQTVGSLTISAPNPTNTTPQITVSVNNTGSAAFTFTATGVSTTIPAGAGIYMQWTGAGYSLMNGGGGSATTPSSVASTGAVTSSSATAGIGYATGAGGTVTQGTSRTTGVTLSKVCGAITLFTAAGSATPFSFTVTNTTVAATDRIIVNQVSGTDHYAVYVTNVAAGSFQLTVVDLTGTTSEAPVIGFAVHKAVTA